MSECKHRWVVPPWAKKIMDKRKTNDYFFGCTRCNQCRFVRLIGSTAQ